MEKEEFLVGYTVSIESLSQKEHHESHCYPVC